MQDAAHLDGAVLVVELQHRHLDLHVAAVAAAQPGHAHGRPGPVPLGHGDAPAGVLLVDEPVAAQAADLLDAHVEHGAGGRVGGGDPAVRGAEEHALGAVREQGAVGGEADRAGVLNHHAVPPSRAGPALTAERTARRIENTEALPELRFFARRL